jgi:hypothetical protein
MTLRSTVRTAERVLGNVIAGWVISDEDAVAGPGTEHWGVIEMIRAHQIATGT